MQSDREKSYLLEMRLDFRVSGIAEGPGVVWVYLHDVSWTTAVVGWVLVLGNSCGTQEKSTLDQENSVESVILFCVLVALMHVRQTKSVIPTVQVKFLNDSEM